MLVHRTIDSPIGALTLYSTPAGLSYLAFSDVEQYAAQSVEDTSSAGVAVAQLEEFFAGRRREFSVPLDVPGEGFQRRAQQLMAEIPFGETRTYTQLAEATGNPNAVRAAGTACAKNPVPLIWPCHRIIRSDGTWGTYRGGEEAKTWLLNFEAGNPAGPGAV
ncbi:methylated-DNA--[protein]-cysteine S-methyltransferase [Corynebacterium doosanense]|uniref:methylated-DNA--[protein]-cysteine S-methyltransferase n=1 Tax=Corynebacterium doosanense CAU 212 = DSM 45436 TaxID=558173 RepID=A0A097IEL3_9CORY|nr:methylated-DNA--[protein]-cysteine S-methyltransferase [Corynebacterium doosanense]AIT60570.1 cysteine methyltransferase [Corynebacterium doosanense CAU 212 = DSM 45436]